MRSPRASVLHHPGAGCARWNVERNPPHRSTARPLDGCGLAASGGRLSPSPPCVGAPWRRRGGTSSVVEAEGGRTKQLSRERESCVPSGGFPAAGASRPRGPQGPQGAAERPFPPPWCPPSPPPARPAPPAGASGGATRACSLQRDAGASARGWLTPGPGRAGRGAGGPELAALPGTDPLRGARAASGPPRRADWGLGRPRLEAPRFPVRGRRGGRGRGLGVGGVLHGEG